jgi:hypothetical protein
MEEVDDEVEEEGSEEDEEEIDSDIYRAQFYREVELVRVQLSGSTASHVMMRSSG